MPNITLPDGSVRHFEQAVSIYDIAASIGTGLARATLAGKVDGKMVDTSFVVDHDAEVTMITAKDEDGLEVIRHSCAHLLAQAVKQLFPSAQVTIGPVIDDGFYYDFAFGRAFTPEDLERIEKKMQELAKADIPVSRRTLPRDEAIVHFRDMGEEYKAKIIEDIPANETLSLYQQGDFEDLCRGPHVPSTGFIKAFKLTKISGAYWRGDANNEMLQRVYGTAWPDKKALNAYLHRLEEAEKRDHRKLGKAQHLFHFQEEAPGMVFWHDNGWTIYNTITQYIRKKLSMRGYDEVHTPQVVDRKLWERSGHWDMFGDEMFVTETESKTYAIKPMNCPCHVQIFNQGLKSYRDLPIRIAEFGNCHRCEPSGALHGLMRLRNFVQDDAHVFCTDAQIQDEVAKMIELLFEVYHDFGFDDVIIKLSTRPEKRVGSDEVWDKAEKALADALDSKNLPWEEFPGEGAFYGPKIEFSLTDCIGRVWQCGTIQVDFSMPDRLGAQYVAEDGNRVIPVMIHRAILGSIERFIGIIIENYAGKFPVWLAPKQAIICNITDNQAEYAREVAKNLQNAGFRVNFDLRNEKIGFKIREHTLQRVPYLVIVGDKELENQQIAVRTREGQDLGSMSLADFQQRLHDDNSHLGRQISTAMGDNH